MNRCYSSVVSAAIAAAKSHHTIYQGASPTLRPRLYDLLVGTVSTPADAAIELGLYRTTAAPGTPVSVTPQPLDPGDQAASLLSSSQAAAEPTKTAQIFPIPMHQRVTVRFCTQPGSEIVIPCTANAGLTLFCNAVSAGTPTLDSTLFFVE